MERAFERECRSMAKYRSRWSKQIREFNAMAVKERRTRDLTTWSRWQLPHHLLLLLVFILPCVSSLHVLESCCVLQDEAAAVGQLYNCVNGSISARPPVAPPVINKSPRSLQLVTFATRKDWEEYAGLSSAINVAFAQAHGYVMSLHVVSEEDERDETFCKIKTLYLVLQQQPRVVEYVVWLDADLILLQTHGKELEGKLAKYRKADLIMGREQQTSSDNIASTGFVIVRNTAWSKNFLHSWWNELARARERGLATPEQVLSKLWHNQHPDISEHVELISPNALNMKHMHIHAAPFPGHRQAIFASAFASLCDWHDKSNRKSEQEGKSQFARLKPQLGLTRQAMRDIEMHVLGGRKQKVQELFAALSDNNYSTCQFALVVELKEKLFDVILKLGDASVGDDADLLQTCMIKFLELTQHQLQRQTEPEVETAKVEVEVDAHGRLQRRQQQQQETLALLRYAVDVSFELARGKPALQQVDLMLHVAPFTAELLAKSDHQAQLVEALCLELKRFQILAKADHDKQLDHLQSALQVWFEVQRRSPQGVKEIVEEGASLLASIGSIMCTKKIGAFEQGLEASHNSTHLVEDYWEKKYHGGGPAAVPSSVLHSLAKTYRTMGSCAERQLQSNCTLAKEYFGKALSMRRYLSKWDELMPEDGEEEMSLQRENKNEMVLLVDRMQWCGEEEEEETKDEE